MGTLLGGEKNTTREQMKDIISFEVELASIMEPDETRRDEDKNYHRMPIFKLQKLAPFVSFIRRFRLLLSLFLIFLQIWQ